jgi:hypothetical protein
MVLLEGVYLQSPINGLQPRLANCRPRFIRKTRANFRRVANLSRRGSALFRGRYRHLQPDRPALPQRRPYKRRSPRGLIANPQKFAALYGFPGYTVRVQGIQKDTDMKFAIALTAFILCVSPASARCGLLSWQRDDTCAGPFQPKSPQEIVAADMAWCKAHVPTAIDACLTSMAHARDVRRPASSGGDDGPSHCATNVVGSAAFTNCY